jgi:hypothetical protein
MSTATPWWGTLVVAIIGFAGIVISQWLSGHRERSRTGTEQKETARQRRVEAYAEFISKFQEVIVAVDGSWVDRPDEEQLFPLWNALSRQSFVIQLLAPPNVASAMGATMACFNDVLELVRQGTHDGPELRSAHEKFDVAGNLLARSMRQDSVGDGYEPNRGTRPPEDTKNSSAET